MQTCVADLQGYFAYVGQTAPNEWGVWLYFRDEIVIGLTFQDAQAVIMHFGRRGALHRSAVRWPSAANNQAGGSGMNTPRPVRFSITPHPYQPRRWTHVVRRVEAVRSGWGAFCDLHVSTWDNHAAALRHARQIAAGGRFALEQKH